ncbi:MAG: D-alanine--D-alanine ligase [Campylobacterota bacterium]|nr:D-alanine--D-alanine ligase [Campylobacterota bacterium]
MNIAIVFGAQSFEHEISIVSSIAMKDVLKCDLTYIFVDQNREFYHIPTQSITSKVFSSSAYAKEDKLFLQQGGFFKKSFLGTKPLEFDTVLNLTHGGDGEDGVLAALFEFYSIPFIGPGVEACSISSNKFLTKGYAHSIGVNTLEYQYFCKGDDITIAQYPVIIKPVRLGSSIGVSIVKSSQELDYALDVAFEFDDAIIAETFVKDIKEYNLAGTKINGEFQFSIVEEPQKNEFLDFDKKYLDFTRTSRVSKADISDDLEQKLRQNFEKVYNTLFEGSIIRCDFFVIDDTVYLNEINSIPGSMANYLFDDFNGLLMDVAYHLRKKSPIKVTYDYVNKIQSAKGK